MLGEKNPFYGKNHSIETKQKMSKSKKGNKFWLGKQHSDETKEKQRLIKLGSYDGIKNPNSKLTTDQILEINIKYKTGLYSFRQLGKEYNVLKTCIRYNIKVNK